MVTKKRAFSGNKKVVTKRRAFDGNIDVTAKKRITLCGSMNVVRKKIL